MARPKHDLEQKRDIAIRLQGLVNDGFASLYEFRKALRAKGLEAHEATVRGWLPPQERWKQEKMRPADWKAVNLPDAVVLAKVCNAFDWSADWILLGAFPPYRSLDRSVRELGVDLSQYIYNALRERYPDMAPAMWIVGTQSMLPRITDSVLEDAAVLLEAAEERKLWHSLWQIVRDTPPSIAREILEASLKKAKFPPLERNGLHLLTETRPIEAKVAGKTASKTKAAEVA